MHYSAGHALRAVLLGIMDSVETCSAYAEAGKVQVLQAAAMLGRN